MHYTDDSDQLPPLPDFGPRDGKHGVDRDESYDPYPATRIGVGSVNALTVSVADARLHLAVLVERVAEGDEVMIVRDGVPVARLVSAVSAPRSTRGGATAVDRTAAAALPGAPAEPAAAAQGRRKPKETTDYIDHGAHLLELPDGGPSDGRHGVDRDRGFMPSGS
ncbi:MAG: type II toxin-antitoxin system prevent-host-death family antitoxin [Microbacteriaceae bacterium]